MTTCCGFVGSMIPMVYARQTQESIREIHGSTEFSGQRLSSDRNNACGGRMRLEANSNQVTFSVGSSALGWSRVCTQADAGLTQPLGAARTQYAKSNQLIQAMASFSQQSGLDCL